MVTKHIHTSSTTSSQATNGHEADAVVVRGQELTIDEIVRVARHGAKVRLTDDEKILNRVEASRAYIAGAVENNKPVYGVTSGFGGMAHVTISRE